MLERLKCMSVAVTVAAKHRCSTIGLHSKAYRNVRPDCLGGWASSILADGDSYQSWVDVDVADCILIDRVIAQRNLR